MSVTDWLNDRDYTTDDWVYGNLSPTVEAELKEAIRLGQVGLIENAGQNEGH